MPAGFYSLDREWRFTHVNAEAERLLGRTREELLGRVLWDDWPAAINSIFEDSYRTAVRTGVPVSFDAYYPAPLDGWYELRAWPSPDGLSVYFLEVTERRRDAGAGRALGAAAGDPRPGQRRAGRHPGRARRRPRTCRGSSSRRWPTSASSPWSTRTGAPATSAPGTPTRRPARCSSATPPSGWTSMPGVSPVARALISGEPVRESGPTVLELLPPGEAQDLLGVLAPRDAPSCCRCAAAAAPSAC